MGQPSYASKKKYDDANTVRVALKLNKKTDADILEYLEWFGNKQGAIKAAIREKMERDGG